MAWDRSKVYIKLGEPRCSVLQVRGGKYVGMVTRYITSCWIDSGTCLMDSDEAIHHYTRFRYSTADGAMKAAIRLSKKKIKLTTRNPPRYRRRRKKGTP